jgi:molybdopterin-containing oxidoreductase family membrane subunit
MSDKVLGLYEYVDEMLVAADAIKSDGYEVEIFSPIPISHEIDPVLGDKPTTIKYITLLGNFIGIIFGFTLTLGTAAMYVLPRGGRAIWALTPSLLITYETTILFGVGLTLLGFLGLTRLPNYSKRTYDIEVSLDSFGLLVVGVGSDRKDGIEKIMNEAGAREVKEVD